MAREMSTYNVVYERDTDEFGRAWWLARVPSVQGCHTQGRTIDQARRRIREALGLFVNDPKTAKLIDDVHLPAAIRVNLRAYRERRDEAAAAERKATAAARAAVRTLKRQLHVSTRDAAEMLGLVASAHQPDRTGGRSRSRQTLMTTAAAGHKVSSGGGLEAVLSRLQS